MVKIMRSSLATCKPSTSTPVFFIFVYYRVCFTFASDYGKAIPHLSVVDKTAVEQFESFHLGKEFLCPSIPVPDFHWGVLVVSYSSKGATELGQMEEYGM